MVSACLARTFSPSYIHSIGTPSFYQGLSKIGGILAGAYLGWNILANGQILAWSNAAAVLTGSLFAYCNYALGKFVRGPVDDHELRLFLLRSAIRENSLPRLLELTGAQDHPDLKKCKNVQDFFTVLMPSSIDLPRNWQQIVNKVGKAKSLNAFEREAYALSQNKERFVSYNNFVLQLSHDGNYSAAHIAELLMQANPLFKRAWELAGRPAFKDCAKGEFEFDTKLSPACYKADRHLIKIYRETPLEQKIECVIFETFNALQKESFLKIGTLKANIDANEYEIINEWVEHYSNKWRARLYASMGNDCFLVSSFQNWWKHAFKAKHPDIHRKHWIKTAAAEFLLKHRKFLKRR